ncbi:MAG: hydantoinase/oxoprolinase family protein [Steroidobacteraceae bacterium]
MEYGEQVAGVDIGGTFTDLVAFGEQGLVCSKTATTADAPVRGVADCLKIAGLAPDALSELLHASTIAINTVLERSGTTTALLTTRGFADVYAIGRSNRPQSFDLAFRRSRPLVARQLRLEIDERIDGEGRVLTPLDTAQVERLGEQLVAAGVRGVAICFLHSYRNSAHEARVAHLMRERHPQLFVTASYEILREIREYERTSTTVLNAYVGPKVEGYLGELDSFLASRSFRGSLQIMRSNGGVMSVDQARFQPVWMMESGAVAGMIGAAELARRLGLRRAIGLDMGGTTAKATLIDSGVPLFREGYRIGDPAAGHPMQLPVVDVLEIGAGGGSLAWVDAQGALRIGPESAGSSPGPACYQRGGTRPTVTDANLLLGQLNAQRFLGGAMQLDAQLAAQAMQSGVCGPLGMSLQRAAQGVVQIADTMMSLAVRAVSLERGVDPRDCTLIAFGGAGPLHAVAIARELGIPRVAVPRYPGTFSALGMLLAEWRQDFVQTFVAELEHVDGGEINRQFELLAAPGWRELRRDGLDTTEVMLTRIVDLRYRGQDHALPVRLDGVHLDGAGKAELRGKFDALHESYYGHASPNEPVELVNLRLSIRVPRNRDIVTRLLALPYAADRGEKQPESTREIMFGDMQESQVSRVVWRPALEAEEIVKGPAVIEEANSTVLIHPGDVARVHETGVIMIDVASR